MPANYPYTNFQELNLDWILQEVRKVKDFDDRITNLENNDILTDEELEALRTELDDMKAAIAPEFDENTVFTPRTYVWHDGDLYQLSIGHAAGVTWANTVKSRVYVGSELNILYARDNQIASDVDAVEDDVADLKSAIGDGLIVCNGSYSSNIWTTNYYSAFLEVTPGSTFSITANASNTSPIAGLQSLSNIPPAVGESAVFSTANGWTGVVWIAANDTYKGIIPNDVHYLYFYYGLTDSFDRNPTKVIVGNVDYTASIIENLVNTNSLFDSNKIPFTAEMSYYENTVLFDSANPSANNASTMASAPFILPKHSNTPSYLNSVTLLVRFAGTLTIGTIKKKLVYANAPFTPDMFHSLTTITFRTTGMTEYKFTTPYRIESDEFLYIGDSTDTLQFYYGGTATDSGFFWSNHSTDKFTNNASPLGITVSIYKDNSSIINSKYYGKKLSILGDSISTYSGYIPVGNVTYYPSGDVQQVTDTWWKKLIDGLGLTLELNNSWSGSRVTTTNGNESAGCMTRAQNLGTAPDVIIIWMGINDFNNEVVLGTYDGKSSVPATTTTFREAYGIMLDKVLTAYPEAEVWVCTLPQCEKNASTGFPEINDSNVPLVDYNEAIVELANAFNVKILYHDKCGLTYQNMSVYNPDQLHPNKNGHSLIANNDLRQLDSFSRARY